MFNNNNKNDNNNNTYIYTTNVLEARALLCFGETTTLTWGRCEKGPSNFERRPTQADMQADWHLRRAAWPYDMI